MPLLLLFVCFLVCFTIVLSPHPLKLSDNNSLIIIRILYTMRVVVNPMKCSGTKIKAFGSVGCFQNNTTRCQMDKGWINTCKVSQNPSFILQSMQLQCFITVIWYIEIFFAIKSDKNHQLQSKSHRNNNDKNSICKRIII